jgi:uncharacterized protein YaaN involved in tellurite resistance
MKPPSHAAYEELKATVDEIIEQLSKGKIDVSFTIEVLEDLTKLLGKAIGYYEFDDGDTND